MQVRPFLLSQGLTVMDRSNALHRNARVDLPTTVSLAPAEPPRTARGLRPKTYFYLNLLYVSCCSAVVIITASLLALQIQ